MKKFVFGDFAPFSALHFVQSGKIAFAAISICFIIAQQKRKGKSFLSFSCVFAKIFFAFCSSVPKCKSAPFLRHFNQCFHIAFVTNYQTQKNQGKLPSPSRYNQIPPPSTHKCVIHYTSYKHLATQAFHYIREALSQEFLCSFSISSSPRLISSGRNKYPP